MSAVPQRFCAIPSRRLLSSKILRYPQPSAVSLQRVVDTETVKIAALRKYLVQKHDWFVGDSKKVSRGQIKIQPPNHLFLIPEVWRKLLIE